jgi:mono/diheme cytochrome c family protein
MVYVTAQAVTGVSKCAEIGGVCMKLQNSNGTDLVKQLWLTVAIIVAFLVVASHGSRAQEAKKASPSGTDSSAVARGQYIVEGVAVCGNCHTPRRSDGELDRSRWLAGAPVPYQPSAPTADWPMIAPRIAGLPPASNAGMITLLTTGIWTTGKPLRNPMPQFHMTRADAEAVLAYLKSLNPGR